jgi:hypothetical protein
MASLLNLHCATPYDIYLVNPRSPFLSDLRPLTSYIIDAHPMPALKRTVASVELSAKLFWYRDAENERVLQTYAQWVDEEVQMNIQ